MTSDNRPARERVPSFWTLQVAGWSAFGVAMASSRIGMVPAAYMIASKSVLAALGLVASLGLWRVYRRIYARGVRVTETIAACTALSYVGACVWTAAFNILDRPIQRAMLARPDIIRPGLFGLFVGSVYHAFALFGWSVLYFAIRHYEALQLERERSLRAESLAHAAQLDALRYQLNPHFLFNTLNAISTLVVDRRNDDASRMLSRLSDFLRTTLDADASEVSLTEEIDIARRYLDIEQVRFGDRLRVTIDVHPEAWQASVPVFLLQPLVENAIQHAIAANERGGEIRITADRAGDVLTLSVADDGLGLTQRCNGSADGNGTGIGLANTRSRLQHIYGALHRFDVGDGPRGGVVARIEIPFQRVATVVPGA